MYFDLFSRFLKDNRAYREFLIEYELSDGFNRGVERMLRSSPEYILMDGGGFFHNKAKTGINWGALETKWVGLLKSKGFDFDKFIPISQFGEQILVGDTNDDVVHRRLFIEMTTDNFYLCYEPNERDAKGWAFAKPTVDKKKGENNE